MKSFACWLLLGDNTSLSHKNNMAAKSVLSIQIVPYITILRVCEPIATTLRVVVILAGQVSRQTLQGNLLRFTLTHHWQFWVVMINGGKSAYFQTDLLDFDAFLTIFFILSGIPCGVIPDFTHRRTDWGWLSTHGVAVHFKWPMNQ